MNSSEAYLGAFESSDQIKVTINKESIEIAMSELQEKDITISDIVWKQIYDAIYETDLVADFVEGAIAKASVVVSQNLNSVK